MLVLFFSACEITEKSKTINNDEAQTLLVEAVTAFSIYSKTQDEVAKAAIDTENLLKSTEMETGEYPQITIEPFNLIDWPKTITINYGVENHLGLDGRYRRGELVITANNFAHITNAVWDINFSDFYQNDHKVEGTQSIKYKGLNANNNPEYSCVISDGIITSPTGKVFYFEQQTNREWIAGDDTHFVLTGESADLCDDEYLISGIHSGVSSDGYSYSMTADEDPLHVNVCCKWVMDGKLQIELPDNNLECAIDFRNGAETGEMCNNVAAFTIFGVTYPIIME